jgi:ParB family chromosome partitioning protein
VVGAFYAEEIGVGHALLLAKLQPDQQEKALAQCFREEWAGGGKNATQIMLPVRHLKQWIEHQLLLILKLAPFDKRDAQLVPSAGSCVNCPKRTGHDKLLFTEWREDACTDPTCYAAKVEAHIAKTVASKPELIQISRGYSRREEGSTVLPRNRYTEIRTEKPASKDEGKGPEFKVCKFTREAIITRVNEAHDAIRKWMAANRRESAGHSWEIYGDPTSDPADTETTVVYLLT